MMKTLLATTSALSLVACIPQDITPQDIDRALPTADQVSIKLPQTSARTIDGQDAVGQTATFYGITRGVTQMFNGGSARVLALIHTIIQFPVTTTSDNMFTWGPWSQALDPAEYKLEVYAFGDGGYAYTLSGRSKEQPNADFSAVVDGTVDSRDGETKDSGEFDVSFDMAKFLDPTATGDAKGSVSVTYDLAKGHLDLTLWSYDADDNTVITNYAYNQAADGGGDMVFDANTNIDRKPLLENLTLHSRWLGNGAGRADVRIAGGDLGGLQATASECWGTAFQRLFYTDSAGFGPTEGDQTACSFATVDLPALK